MLSSSARASDVAEHAHQQVLHELELRDRPAELLALHGQRCVGTLRELAAMRVMRRTFAVP